jgi:hypothetical protein
MNFVQTHPDMQSTVGVKWIDQETFIVSSQMLANVLKIKVNTLNYNFRMHGFFCQRTLQWQLPRKLMNAPEPISWYKPTHVCQMFTTSSAEQDARIMGRFNLKKITRAAAMLWLQRQMMIRHPEHNAEQPNGIDSPVLSRISGDSENEEIQLWKMFG